MHVHLSGAICGFIGSVVLHVMDAHLNVQTNRKLLSIRSQSANTRCTHKTRIY